MKQITLEEVKEQAGQWAVDVMVVMRGMAEIVEAADAGLYLCDTPGGPIDEARPIIKRLKERGVL